MRRVRIGFQEFSIALIGRPAGPTRSLVGTYHTFSPEKNPNTSVYAQNDTIKKLPTDNPSD